MRKYLIVFVLLMLVVWIGCKPRHPSEITMDPEFDPNNVGSILVAPFISSVSEGQDEDRKSERIMNRVLFDLISERTDHRFLSPEQFRMAVRKAGLAEEYETFKNHWITKHEVDKNFLRRLQGNLDIDLLLVPHVYLWLKDEADYRELGTASSTQVGATLTLIDFSSGTTMWEATDENYKESVRTEGDREQSSAAGPPRRISGVTVTGRDMYAAPPFEDVALLVLKILVDAIPMKGTLEE